jgi:hypothetical protein
MVGCTAEVMEAEISAIDGKTRTHFPLIDSNVMRLAQSFP